MRICDFCKDLERAKNGLPVKEREVFVDKWDACDDCWAQVESKCVLLVRQMANGQVKIHPSRPA